MTKTQRAEKQRKTAQTPTDYDVGKGRPPKHTQFKLGVSGNPKGKPKSAKNQLKEATATVDLSVNGKLFDDPRDSEAEQC